MTIQLTDAQKIRLLNSDDVFSVMQEILLREEKIDQEKEHLWMIGLATNNRILYIELVSLGSVRATKVEPMNVYRVAVLKGAVKVIMVHNHPDGELQPSEEDKDVTDRLIQVGKILNIEMIDHMVISTRSYLSFKDTGIMFELELSTKWVPQYELIKQIRAEEKKIREEALRMERKKAKKDKEKAVKKSREEGKQEGKEEGLKEGEIKGIKKGKIEMAKKMKEREEPLDKIEDYTGLTKGEIEKIKIE